MLGFLRDKKCEKETFEIEDALLARISLATPCKISVTIVKDKVTVQVGPRDYTWDRKSKTLVDQGIALF